MIEKKEKSGYESESESESESEYEGGEWEDDQKEFLDEQDRLK